jgi:hypothetical protein
MLNKRNQIIRMSAEARFFWVIATMFVPFVALSVFIALANAFNWSGPFDFVWLAVAVGIGIGLYWAATRGLHLAIRILILAVYTPVITYLLFFYIFLFAGVVYGRWL